MSITLLLGPMMSGKSSRLIQEVSGLAAIGKTAVFINYEEDRGRLGNDKGEIATYDGLKAPAICSKKLIDIDVSNYDVVGINEGQFFPDLVEFCDKYVAAGKWIFIAALSGTYELNGWPVILSLIPKSYCIFLRARCQLCGDGTYADFTKKIAGDMTTEKDVGGKDKYMPVCRKHMGS